jgi:hypothetical protein
LRKKSYLRKKRAPNGLRRNRPALSVFWRKNAGEGDRQPARGTELEVGKREANARVLPGFRELQFDGGGIRGFTQRLEGFLQAEE